MITFVANALGGTTTTTSFSITLPATLANDIIILEYTHRGTGDATLGGTYNGGSWTEKHDQQYASSAFSGKTVWSRATGNHSGQTVTGSGLTDSCAAIVTIYRGALTTGDPLADATVVGEQNASANETQAQITTTTNGAWVVLVVANSPDLAVTSQAATSPSVLVSRAERLSTGGTDTSIAHASEEKGTAGATGSFTWAQTDQASGSWAYAIKPEPPALTQASYRFYADGTDLASTPLADKDTNYTADVTSGDVNLQLRVRLQNTNALAGSSLDDYQLQYELNDSASWVDVTTSSTAVLAFNSASLSSTNAGSLRLEPGVIDNQTGNLSAGQQLHASTSTIRGQSITGNGQDAKRALFWLARVASPTGNATAEIFAHSGTFGTSSVGTGSALATSSNVNVANLATTAEYVEFTFPTALTLTNGTNYSLVVHYNGGDSTNRLTFNSSSSSVGHPGNVMNRTEAGVWTAENTLDALFVLYDEDTGGNATGLPSPPKVSEDGLVDNVQIRPSGFTEFLYSLTIDGDALSNGDTLDFRVQRNAATTGMTYTAIPRITITKSAGGASTSDFFHMF